MNRYIEALKENYNGIGMAAVIAVSAATFNPLPLLAGLVAEAAYLVLVPDSKWYQARLARRMDAEAQAARRKLRDQVLPTLRPEMQARFAHLEEMRQQIGTQDDKAWYLEVVRKLDYLLEKFLLFGAKEAQFQSYLTRLRAELRSETPNQASPPPLDGDWDLGPGRTDAQQRGGSRRSGRKQGGVPQRPLRLVDAATYDRASGDEDDEWVQRTVAEIQGHYTEECGRIEALIQTDEDEANRAVLTKRVDVLQRRAEFAGKIGKILGNINHQLQLVDDTFGLINDEIRARSPEQILADIDEVCVATDSMSSTLEEIAPYEQMVARTGS